MKKLLVCLVSMVFLAAAGTAQADTIGFWKLTNNNTEDLSGQLWVEVTDASVGGVPYVNFKFTNVVGITSSITDIYFDDGTLLAMSTISDSGVGVAFSSPASPGDLPGGGQWFQTTNNWSADSDSPVMANGVNSNTEWVTIKFQLLAGKTFADTITALTNESGDLKIGLHVQNIGAAGGSDSYVTEGSGGPFEVPEPGTFLILTGMLGLGLMRSRKLFEL